MSLKLSIKGCEDITQYYFGRTEGGLVGAFYCMARPVVRTEEDNCAAEPWAGYSWVGYSKELGRLYVFSKPWEVSEVFRLSRGFRPLCTPPVRWGGGVSRWWGFGYAILKGDFGDAYIDVYGVVTENLEFVKMKTPDLFDKVERCRGMFERAPALLSAQSFRWLGGRGVILGSAAGLLGIECSASWTAGGGFCWGTTAFTRLSSRLLSKSRWRSSARLGM
jgi:hypothetical protein